MTVCETIVCGIVASIIATYIVRLIDKIASKNDRHASDDH